MRPRLLLPLLVLCSSLHAQQQPSVSETIEVRLLEVDVIVTDKYGKPVRGLTAADFELLENGKAQPITNFSEYADTVTTTKPGARPAPAPANVSRPEPRTIVMLVDPLPVRGPARKQIFENIRSLTERTLRKEDRAQILGWTGSRFAPFLDFTSDRSAVLGVLTQMEVNPTAKATGRSIEEIEMELREQAAAAGLPYDPEVVETEKRHMAEQELAIMRRKTASMQRIVSSLTSADSRTIVLYISDQFSRIAGKLAFIGARSAGGPPSADEAAYDTMRMIESVIKTANANGVAFYTIRPHIPSTSGEFRSRDEEALVVNQTTGGTEAISDQLLLQNEIEALSPLAEQTGGMLAVGPKGTADAVERIVTDLGSYYSLGWRAQSDGTDRERRIRVRPKNPDYFVRTRTTLVEKSEKTRAADLLVARLFEDETATDIDFEITIGAAKAAGRGRSKIPVTIAIPSEQLDFVTEGSETVARFTVLTVAGKNFAETTNVTRDSRRVTGGAGQGVIRYSFEVLADAQQRTMSIGVYDESTRRMGVRRLDLSQGTAAVATEKSFDVTANAAWEEARARADRENKPLLVFFRPKRCKVCDTFEQESVVHPAIVRRMPQVVFTSVPIATPWTAKDPGLALVDEEGAVRAKWVGVPDTAQFGTILDTVVASAPNFQRAFALRTTEGPYGGTVETAIGLTKLGRADEARLLLDQAIAKGNPRQQQLARVTRSYLEARDGRAAGAIAELDRIVATTTDSDVRAEAWLAAATIHRAIKANDEAVKAYRAAIEAAGADSPLGRAAAAQLAQIQPLASSGVTSGVVRLVQFHDPIVTGDQTVQTIVSSTSVARVTFSVDGRETARVHTPPFSAPIRLGRTPETHVVRAVAYDVNGAELGRDEMTVNNAGEVFWIRLAEPSGSQASGAVLVAFNLRTPATRRIRKVTVSWNDRPIGSLTAAPWQTTVTIPDEIGVLQAVAELDDGRTTEDAVLLNTPGYVERTEVQVVEIPVTVTPATNVDAKDVTVREGRTARTIESVTMGAEAPLTVGLLFDTSASMQKRLPDLQEAAIRFIDSSLGPADRAFLISFDSSARLLQGPTTDRDALRRAIMSLHPQGLTALNDAMVLGLLQFEGVRGRRGLVVFTDGMDRTSRYKAADLTTLSRRSNVPIYLITPPLNHGTMTMAAPAGPRTRRGAAEGMPVMVGGQGAKELETVTSGSGGRLHEMQKLEQLPAIYASISDALRAQMIVSIRTDPARKENDWREIEVDVKRRGVDVRAPAGYYAR